MPQKWLIAPGETQTIELDRADKLKITLIGGQVDVIAHDEPGIRIEVQGVTVKDLRIEHDGVQLEIDHPQLAWDNFLDVFRGFSATGPRAEVSVAVPRDIALSLGVVSASVLVSGLHADGRLNTVTGGIIVDAHRGDLVVNAVSGDLQVQNIVGAITANSVSGDVAVTGVIRKTIIDTVSGAILVDAASDVDSITLNSVGGAATVRLPENLAAKYTVRSLTGRLTIDGVDRSSSRPGSYNGSTGELSGTFVDVRANSVSGDVTVLRNAKDEAAA